MSLQRLTQHNFLPLSHPDLALCNTKLILITIKKPSFNSNGEIQVQSNQIFFKLGGGIMK